MAAPVSIEERFAILDVISSYAYTWDERRVDDWIDLFTDDAVIRASFLGDEAWKHSSNAERRTFMESYIADAKGMGLIRSRHFQTNTVMEKQDDGTIKAVSMFTVAVQFEKDAAPTFGNTGAYVDVFVKTDSGWKFRLRDIDVDQKAP